MAFKAIFFDAAGTLFYLTKTVGDHYALVGRELGLSLDPQELDRAFYSAWNRVRPRDAINGPRENDDKDWWRQLVDLVLHQVAPSLDPLDRDNFFELAYEHFAEAGVWELFPEVVDILEELHPRLQLAVISNFDGRLRMILEQLGISKYFDHVFVSSELGADKPSPEIFRRALKFVALESNQVYMLATIRSGIGRQHRRRFIDLSIRSTKEFASRRACDPVAASYGKRGLACCNPRAARLQRRGYKPCGEL